MYIKIKGSTMVVGDLHLDETANFYKDYQQVCLDVLYDIVKRLEENSEIRTLLFTGDISGATSKRRFKSLSYRGEITNIFMKFNKLVDNVISLRGNHDESGVDISELDYLSTIGLVKLDIDYLETECGKRIHLINYGEDKRTLAVSDFLDDTVIVHTAYKVLSEKMWFYCDFAEYLEDQTNLTGCTTVLAGHIHNTSPKILNTRVNGVDTSLLYVGSPTRPVIDKTNNWNHVFYPIINEAGDISPNLVKLKPLEDLIDMDLMTTSLNKVAPISYGPDAVVTRTLEQLIESLTSYNPLTADLERQIKVYPGYSNESRKRALSFYAKADIN